MVLSVEIAPPECFTVIVHNVWTANEAEACGPAFFDELESEFSQECAKYGPLRSCKAVPREPSLVGAVVVAFSTEEGREKCEGDMDGRWFDFRRLRVRREKLIRGVGARRRRRRGGRRPCKLGRRRLVAGRLPGPRRWPPRVDTLNYTAGSSLPGSTQS